MKQKIVTLVNDPKLKNPVEEGSIPDKLFYTKVPLKIGYINSRRLSSDYIKVALYSNSAIGAISSIRLPTMFFPLDWEFMNSLSIAHNKITTDGKVSIEICGEEPSKSGIIKIEMELNKTARQVRFEKLRQGMESDLYTLLKIPYTFEWAIKLKQLFGSANDRN